jgi:hypothetical protein
MINDKLMIIDFENIIQWFYKHKKIMNNLIFDDE